MMSNLFSIFDPSTNNFINWNWISPMINLMFLPSSYWMFKNRMYFFFNMIIKVLFKEFKIILCEKFNYLNIILFCSIFTLILINNFMGMFPYIFTASSHLIYSISISLPMWMGLMIFSWGYNTNFTFCHLIPQGTPNLLMPLMTWIESISNIIRPGTLSIRLTANMIAGHLLVTLLSSSTTLNINIMNFFIIMIQTILLTLEFSVAIIQSYVFAILTTLYTKETNYE